VSFIFTSPRRRHRFFAGESLRSSGTVRRVRHYKKIPASIRSPGNLVIIRLVYDYRES
jgi:hypothetical protein